MELVAFPAVHKDGAGEAFSAAVVEQTYSIAVDQPPPAAGGLLLRFTKER